MIDILRTIGNAILTFAIWLASNIVSILTLVFAFFVMIFIYCGVKISKMTDEEIEKFLEEEKKKKNKKK
jgi:uncharacterized protein YacL